MNPRYPFGVYTISNRARSASYATSPCAFSSCRLRYNTRCTPKSQALFFFFSNFFQRPSGVIFAVVKQIIFRVIKCNCIVVGVSVQYITIIGCFSLSVIKKPIPRLNLRHGNSNERSGGCGFRSRTIDQRLQIICQRQLVPAAGGRNSLLQYIIRKGQHRIACPISLKSTVVIIRIDNRSF